LDLENIEGPQTGKVVINLSHRRLREREVPYEKFRDGFSKGDLKYPIEWYLEVFSRHKIILKLLLKY
jgi:hypothetical protein